VTNGFAPGKEKDLHFWKTNFHSTHNSIENRENI
jgi:hypothetical protein